MELANFFNNEFECPTNCLSVFGHFVGLARKGLIYCFWISLTHFMLLLASYAPWKYKKTFEFFYVSGGIERDQWHEMV